MEQYLAITRLMVKRCSVDELCELFGNIPQLQCLTFDLAIHHCARAKEFAKAMNLEYITTPTFFQEHYDSLELLLKYAPNLRILIINRCQLFATFDHIVTASIKHLQVQF